VGAGPPRGHRPDCRALLRERHQGRGRPFPDSVGA
jgi:hypothetical protein